MAPFHTRSKWLKLSFLEVHLSLLLLLFPLASLTNVTIGPASVLAVTCILLLCACVLTYTWVYIREIYNNRLIHLSVMGADFLVALFAIVSIVVLHQWNDHLRYDNLIEASVCVAILAFFSGLFAVWEMQSFRFHIPRFRLKRSTKNRINTIDGKASDGGDRKEEDDPANRKTPSAPEMMVPRPGSADSGFPGVPDDSQVGGSVLNLEEEQHGVFCRASLWLKYALYLFALALFLTFLPSEPRMIGGTRETTSSAYVISITAFSLLFCWVYLGSMRNKKFVHVVTAIFVFLTGILSLLTMILWLVTWSMMHPFTPMLSFGASLLSCAAGAAIVLEIRQHRVNTSGMHHVDRQMAASCFNGVLHAFRIQGVKVTVDSPDGSGTNPGDVPNGAVMKKYSAGVDGPASVAAPATAAVGDGAGRPVQIPPSALPVQRVSQATTPEVVITPETLVKTEAETSRHTSDTAMPTMTTTATTTPATTGTKGTGNSAIDAHTKVDPVGGRRRDTLPPVSGGMADEYTARGLNPFEDGD